MITFYDIIFYKNACSDAPIKGGILMKEQYISKIITLLNQCDDISLLDLILQLLLKHQH